MSYLVRQSGKLLGGTLAGKQRDEGQAFDNGSLTCCRNQLSRMSVIYESGGDFARF